MPCEKLAPDLKTQNACDDAKYAGRADGLLLVRPRLRGARRRRQADARMLIFNADGSEASMCGNGLRCVAWYLHARDRGCSAFTIETGAGLMRAEIVAPERVRIAMTPPRKIRLGLALPARGKHWKIHSVDTGVPHAVVPVRSIESVDLSALGPAIRFHPRFRPAGTNVDLLKIRSPHRIAVRTYERGVEAETLACGTGAVACVVVGAALGLLKPPVSVETSGGERLTVRFRGDLAPSTPKGARPLFYLEGPARILFKGEMWRKPGEPGRREKR